MIVQCPDGVRLACTLTVPEVSSGVPRYVILNSAAAVRRGFYSAFASYLAGCGFHVLTWDGRGVGESAEEHARDDPARMRDWGILDLEAVLQHVGELAGGDWSRVALLGHSAGGNLCGLAPSLSRINRVVLVASGTCDWRLYPKREWPRLLAAWYGFAPLMLSMLGYVPAKFGVGHDLPRGVGWDWRNWSAERGYLFSDPTLDLRGYAGFSGDLLSLNFTDDTGFAPPATVSDLLRHFSSARIERRTFDPVLESHRPVGHFGFFRQENEDIWPVVGAWLGAAHLT